MKLLFCLLALTVSMPFSFYENEALATELSSRERIIQLRDQVERDLTYLTEFQEKRKSDLASQVILGISTLKFTNEELKRDTEPLVPIVPKSSQIIPDTPLVLAKLELLAARWGNLATSTQLYKETAQNTPEGEDMTVTVRFTLYWKDELIDGWRIGGIETIFVPDKHKVGEEADRLCKTSDLPPHAFFTNNFKFQSEDKKWIEAKLSPGPWYMWTVHPGDCSPKKVNPVTVKVSRKPSEGYVMIQLPAPDKKPKYE